MHFYRFGYNVIVICCFVNLRLLHDYIIFKVNVWSVYKLSFYFAFFFSEKQANEGSSTCIVLAIALVVLGFAVLIACLCIWRKKKMFFMKRGIVSFIAQNCVYIIKLNVSLFLIGKVSDQLYNKIFSFVSHAKGQI